MVKDTDDAFFDRADDMAAARKDTIDYYARQYVAMLEENLDDYIENFGKYMQKKGA